MPQQTFIDSYLERTSIFESPGSFWKWSAYATIAATLKDKCYIRNGDALLFPNLYVLLVAESGGRKNPPVDSSESFVANVSDTKIISGRASVQAIMDELARSETDKVTGKVRKSGAAIFYAPELTAGIVNDPEGMRILTDIYDYKTNPYKSRLRTGPCFNLERIVFSMLTASNEDMLRGLFDASVIKGGFLARNLLVVPNEEREPNSLLRVDHEGLKKSKQAVLDLLKKINTLHGELKLTEEAIQEYEDWYTPFRKSYQQKKEASGIVGRIHTHILKLSMIFAANDLTTCINKGHMELAIQECLGLLPNYSIFTMSHGKSEISQIGGIVIADLISCPDHKASKKELIRKHWQDGLDADTLEKLIATLDSAGMIIQHHTKEGMFIQLTQTCLNTMGMSTNGLKK